MSLKEIYFHIEYPGAKLKGKKEIRIWLSKLVESYQHKIGLLNFILVEDDYLLSINEKYLKHSYYTDIITFDQSESNDSIEGDIYISIDRLMENAESHKILPFIELARLMSHGIYHLMGFDDKTPAEKTNMTELEEKALVLLPQYVSRGTLEIVNVS